MLHVRPMKPAEPEMVPEDALEYVQLHDEKGNPLEEWIHFDPATRKATKGPKPKKPKLVPTGSMKQVDLVCQDCGAGLLGGGNRPFHYMVCGRIDTRDPSLIHLRKPAPPSKKAKEMGAVGRGEIAVIEKVPNAPEPVADSVLECGRYGLEVA